MFQPNPDVVWVGTGEGNPRNSAGVGRGLFKSIDGGHSWRRMGLARAERIHRILTHPTDPDIVYVGVMGNDRLQCLPAREMVWSEDVPAQARFASYKVKWDDDYRCRWDIRNRFQPSLDKTTQHRLEVTCKEIYRCLRLNGYARIDLRLNLENEIVFIEANPNPMLARDEDFAMSAKKAGLGYPKLIDRIISLAT